jgi:hypothetical protein
MYFLAKRDLRPNIVDKCVIEIWIERMEFLALY